MSPCLPISDGSFGPALEIWVQVWRWGAWLSAGLNIVQRRMLDDRIDCYAAVCICALGFLDYGRALLQGPDTVEPGAPDF